MIRKKILKNIEDTYTTEQELLKSLDITHEKLKEHILKLKNVGYKIVYDEEKGYKLQETPDILAPYEISRGLKTEKIGNSIHFYDELESTNDTAKKFVKEDAKEGTVIIAEKQTAGRTRKYDGWVSPEGGIYMTIILRPDVPLIEASKLTIVTGVAIAKTLHDKFGINAGIKWPNDILINGDKVCGVLIEYSGRFVVCGIGINIKTSPTVEQYKTTHLNKYANVDKTELLNRLMRNIDKWMRTDFAIVRARWTDLAIALNKPVKYRGESMELIGINENGALVLRHGSKYLMAYGDEISI